MNLYFKSAHHKCILYIIYFMYVYFSVSYLLFSLWLSCYGILQWNPRGEMFASISSSLLARFRFDSSVSADSSFQVRLTLLFNVSFNSFMKASRIFISFYIYSTIYLILIAQHIILRPILI